MLKSLLLLSAVGVLAFALAPTQTSTAQDTGAAPAQRPAATAANPVKPTAESQAKAKMIYTIDCAMCHGDNGNGQTDVGKSMGLTMTDFSDPKTLASTPDGQLFDAIRNGKDKMPPEDKGRANDTMVWNLVIYIRNLSKSQAAK